MVKASTVITETKSDTKGGAFSMLGDEYRLTLPPGTYEVEAWASGLGAADTPIRQGTVTVRSGVTTTVSKRSMASCS